MAARKTVRTKSRLYDVDPVTGFKRLAYPAGATVPLADFERLTRLNPRATAVEEPGPRPEPASAAPTPWEEMSRGQLLVEARSRGLVCTTRTAKAELVALLEGAER